MIWEFNFLDFLQTLRSPVLDELMIGITSLGDGARFWIGLCIILLIFPRTRKLGLIAGLSFLVTYLLNDHFLKELIGRPRPYTLRDVELLIPARQDFSFPSGHTSMAFAVALPIYYAKLKIGNMDVSRVILLIAGLVAFSRLYLYVHYPTDILGGLILALAVSRTVYSLLSRFLRQDEKK